MNTLLIEQAKLRRSLIEGDAEIRRRFATLVQQEAERFARCGVYGPDEPSDEDWLATQ